ncbi:MAG: hypothetical protein QNJ03_06275 [Dinoroseobacter sp.]|nr:hypothetical protein [Dinoroseobacter sp.]
MDPAFREQFRSGVVDPGTKFNDIISHEDWMMTLFAAAEEPDIVEKRKEGHAVSSRYWMSVPVSSST